MIVSFDMFTVLLTIMWWLWFLIGYILYKVKEKELFWSIAFISTAIIVFWISWFTPTLYFITACNEYTKQVVLFPTIYQNNKLTYGNHIYINNTSKEIISIESSIYWNISESDEQEAYNNWTKSQSIIIIVR